MKKALAVREVWEIQMIREKERDMERGRKRSAYDRKTKQLKEIWSVIL